ncbi:MAG: hypothetical protein RIR55_1001 [Bacteroidota bacterium]|jgi:uncharacterized protein (TIGR00730 family)
MKIAAVTIFCGSKPGNDPAFVNDAHNLGKMLAEKGVTIVYGGGNKGIMGTIANASLDNEGKVIGIIPKVLIEWEAQHTGLSELIVTDSMHSRKLLLYEKCDAAIILPGGMGTMDELFEMLTWNNLGIHEKKVFVLNTNGYYNALIQLLDTMDQQGFMYDNWRSRVIVCDSIESIMDVLN